LKLLFSEDSYRKLVSIDGEGAQLDILDTAGQDDFVTMQDQWMRDGKGFLLVYSITSRSTFEHIATLRDKILRTKNASQVPMVLVGNKCDLEGDRVVSAAEAKAFADKFSMPFFETSAKKKINHEECFYAVVREIRNTGRPVKPPKKESFFSSFCTIL
jgi:GTPase KRas protein